MEANNEQLPGNKGKNKQATTSFILSLVGLIIAGKPLGTSAIISGVWALMNFNPETENNKWMAIFGIILGLIDVFIASALLALWKLVV